MSSVYKLKEVNPRHGEVMFRSVGQAHRLAGQLSPDFTVRVLSAMYIHVKFACRMAGVLVSLLHISEPPRPYYIPTAGFFLYTKKISLRA